MPADRSRRRYDDEADDDRPRRRRDDEARRRHRDQDDDDDDYDDRPRRRRPEAEKSNTGLIVGIVFGVLVLVVGFVAAVLATRNKGGRDTDNAAATPFDGPPRTDRPQGGEVPAFDAEGLPTGNDLDSVLVRLNHRYRQNDFFRYQLEAENLRTLKKPGFARRPEVFRTFKSQAATQAEPRPGTIPHLAWQQAMDWATKDEVPDLCQMLTAERIPARRSDVFSKLAGFKDPRCAEAVAPFLASPELRSNAEFLLKELDSTAEKFVLPYLASNQAKETRVAALQVVAAVGTKDTAKIVEEMTRDPDLQVKHHAKIVFDKMAAKFGVEMDLLAVVKSLKDGIAAQTPVAITDATQLLDKAYRPDHPQRAEIFKALIDCCGVNDPKNNYRLAAFNTTLKWSSKDDVEALCQLLVFSGGESVVFLKLKEYKDPKSAEAVAAFLAAPLKSGEAAAVLKEIGEPAEKAVAPYALRAAPNGAEIPFGVRLAAIDLLADIGTKESVPLLRQLTADPTVRTAAGKSLTKVEARVKGK